MKFLCLSLLVAACTSAVPEAPPAAPADAATARPAPESPSRPSVPRPDSTLADLSAIPDSLHSCIHPGYRALPVRFELIGSIHPDGSPRKVLLEFFDDADPHPLWLQPVILNVSASGCSSDDDPDVPTDAGMDEAYLLLTSPKLARRSAELHVEAAGGPEAYATLYREETGRWLRECRPDELSIETGCLTDLEARTYRELGVPVEAP